MIQNATAFRKLLGAALICMPSMSFAHPDLQQFQGGAFVQDPQTVECTLEDGTETTCYEIVAPYLAEGLETGPFCPATLDDVGGIWDWTGDEAGVYRLNRAFWEMLDAQGYRFYDDDGNVYSVDNASEPPTVDHACINVTADESVKVTMLLPVTPVMADTPTELGTVAKIGVALDGMPIFADAPSVQERGHLPALDVCGGHIDPGGWYHWHATATDIDTVYDANDIEADCSQPQDSAALFGYAFDGFPMFGSTETDGAKPEDLDACNGHVGETALGRTYHYHATEEFPNLPPCLVGVQAANNFATTAANGIGAARGAQGGHGGPDFSEAAETLGVSEEALMQALGDVQGGQPDLAAAAETLGVSEQALSAALPPPPNR